VERILKSKQNGKTIPFRFTFGTNNLEMIPKSMVPSESAPQELSNFLGNFSVPPFVTEVAINP
jgi:hypothetical protein